MKLNLAGGVTAASYCWQLGQPDLFDRGGLISGPIAQPPDRHHFCPFCLRCQSSQLDRVIADLDALVQAVGLKAA